MGNIGQSVAVFLGPVLAAQVGMPTVYRSVAVLLVLVAWAAAFALFARDAPTPAAAQRKGFGAMLEVLTSDKLSWVLGLSTS